jgi:hypothetical protein
MRALRNKAERVDGAVEDITRHQFLPCEYFDLIAGTSTGGSAVVLLAI